MPALAWCQLQVDTSKSAEYLVKEVLIGQGSGIEVLSVAYSGSTHQMGEFKTKAQHIDIREGVILSTGRATDAIGPNDHPGKGSSMKGRGDNELTRIARNGTRDAAILQFIFVPSQDHFVFEFVFASEEYPEYINKGVNDVFAFILVHQKTGERTNLALIPGTGEPVSIDNINHRKNSEYFILNGRWNENNILQWKDNLELGEYAYTFQYDGFTTWLEASSEVIPGDEYILKLAIADAGDGFYDSAVLLKKNSFKAESSTAEGMESESSELMRLFEAERVHAKNDSIVVMLNLNFAPNEWELSDSKSLQQLEEIVRVMKGNNKLKLNVLGFTDGVGSEEDNLELSINRSNFVKKYLIRKGISSDRILAEGRGMAQPIASNQTEEGRAKNRRVEFVFFLQK